MSTFNEHIYYIKNIINKGVASDDARLKDRIIAHTLKQSRSLLIKQKLDRMEGISDLNYQSFCLDFVPHDFHDCNCIPDIFQCQILRSVQEIPAYLVSAKKKYIEFRYVDGRKMSSTSYSNFLFSQFSRASADEPTWFLYDKHIYITNTLSLKKGVVRAIFEDPERVILEECETAGSGPCNPFDGDFPIDADLVLPMYKVTLEMLGLAYNYTEDTENNARSNKTVKDAQ